MAHLIGDLILEENDLSFCPPYVPRLKHLRRSRARANGAPQQYRRASLASSMSQRDNSQPNPPTPSSAVYLPPHLNSNFQASYSRSSGADCRYSKDQLLDFYRTQADTQTTHINIADLYVGGWNPEISTSANNDTWVRRDEQREVYGPEVCWDASGSVEPLSLREMTEEEKEVFIKCFEVHPQYTLTYIRYSQPL